MDSVHLGYTIRTTRKALRLRQSELASVAGVSVRTLSEIENGKDTAQLGLVLKVLDCLGITVALEIPPLPPTPVAEA